MWSPGFVVVWYAGGHTGPALLTSTKLKTPLPVNERPKDSGLLTPASQAKSYLHGRKDSYDPKTGAGYYQEILVDTSNPAKYWVNIRFGGG